MASIAIAVNSRTGRLVSVKSTSLEEMGGVLSLVGDVA